MILKGTIYITNDINLCLSNLNMCKTIVIADEPDQYNIPGKIGGSLLLPPYEAMEYLIDGDMNSFNREYLNYLQTNYSVDKFVSIIIQALIAGTNIIFLLEDEEELTDQIEVTLLNFFVMQYGIIIGTSSRSFAFDTTYTPFILNKLYAEEDMPKETYLNLFPQEIPFDQFTLQKLMYEYDIQFPSLQMANEYFKKQSIIFKNGGLIHGVVKRPE